MKSDEILIKTFDQVKNDNFDQVKFDQVIVCLWIATEIFGKKALMVTKCFQLNGFDTSPTW